MFILEEKVLLCCSSKGFSLYSPCKGFFCCWVFLYLNWGSKYRGCRVCTDCKVLTGKMWFWVLQIKLSLSVWVRLLECVFLCMFMHKSINLHTHTHTVSRLWSGTSAGWLLRLAPSWVSLSSNSTPQPQSFSFPPPSQSPGSAPTPHSLQIASPSHLSQPIINYWWMGRLTGLRDDEGRRKRRKEQAWGREEEVRRAQQTVITLTNWLHLYDTVHICCVLVEGRETDADSYMLLLKNHLSKGK